MGCLDLSVSSFWAGVATGVGAIALSALVSILVGKFVAYGMGTDLEQRDEPAAAGEAEPPAPVIWLCGRCGHLQRYRPDFNQCERCAGPGIKGRV